MRKKERNIPWNVYSSIIMMTTSSRFLANQRGEDRKLSFFFFSFTRREKNPSVFFFFWAISYLSLLHGNVLSTWKYHLRFRELKQHEMFHAHCLVGEMNRRNSTCAEMTARVTSFLRETALGETNKKKKKTADKSQNKNNNTKTMTTECVI